MKSEPLTLLVNPSVFGMDWFPWTSIHGFRLTDEIAILWADESPTRLAGLAFDGQFKHLRALKHRSTIRVGPLPKASLSTFRSPQVSNSKSAMTMGSAAQSDADATTVARRNGVIFMPLKVPRPTADVNIVHSQSCQAPHLHSREQEAGIKGVASTLAFTSFPHANRPYW